MTTTIVGNVLNPESFYALPDIAFDVVYYILTPDEFSEAGYQRAFVEGVKNTCDYFLQTDNKPKRIVFVSSTSVFHQHNGEWVDEKSETTPATFSGRCLLQGEALLQQSDIAATVVRFGGIYGKNRYRLIQQVLKGVGCPQQPVCYTNRIHAEDCVGFLHFLGERILTHKPVDDLYVAVDNYSAPMHEIKKFIADKFSISITDEGDAGRSSKRCRNELMISLGYQFKFPTYKQGYTQVIDDYRGEASA